MAARTTDITGQRFGSLVAIEEVGKDSHDRSSWQCVCDCGRYCEATIGKLTSGEKTSCGCGRNRIEERSRTIGTLEHFAKSLGHSYASNSSGVRGVSFNKQFQKWEATITFRGKRRHLGRFADFDDAVEARRKAEDAILQQKIPLE